MEWLTEKKVLATRDINSNSAGETEELIEKQEKVIDQLDKKRKVGEHQTKFSALEQDFKNKVSRSSMEQWTKGKS